MITETISAEALDKIFFITVKKTIKVEMILTVE